MKKLILTFFFFFAAISLAPAQDAAALTPSSLHALVYLGAGRVLNDGSAPDLAFGGGLRWKRWVLGKTTVVLGIEYCRRGAAWRLDCLDFKASLVYGTTWFLESGLYFSTILSIDAAHDSDGAAKTDAGYLAAFGYEFPIGLTLAASIQGGFADLSGESPYVDRLGHIRRLNLHWGAIVALKIW